MIKNHSFHIPVMGIGYTIDTPLKVSQFGIDSAISLVDDILLEKLRKKFCELYQIHYSSISDKSDDFRAKRITAYLNLISDVAKNKFEEFKNTASEQINRLRDYIDLLPNPSSVKKEFLRKVSEFSNAHEIREWIEENLYMGSIDVNIMTKADKVNYSGTEKLPPEYNDAHAALRGFANSDLESSLILSAGMNPRLYAYIEQFEDFYPSVNGNLKKKIILKVSDYRSALIQGKFLAKKGIWVSEFRIESGLNCGGHAFATDGILLGPVLAEFRIKKTELVDSMNQMLTQALAQKNRPLPSTILPLKISVQGGVGTGEEHQFLIDYYEIDSVGWGTPFLLVPEVTNVDEATLARLIAAKEEDLYLSNISPLGVPFNNLKDNTKDLEKLSRISSGKPGSPCPKKFVSLNTEFTEIAICTASRQYQYLKLKELEEKSLSTEQYQLEYRKIVDKSCICVGLGTSALLVNSLDTKREGKGVSICPGPNMAYFSKRMTLKEIIDHIYGRSDVITRKDRPNLFIKELELYLVYLKNQIEEYKLSISKRQQTYLLTFAENLKEGIKYYQSLFQDLKDFFEDIKPKIFQELLKIKESVDQMTNEITTPDV
ncbi:MAG: hypothetical protein IPL46_06405 [Saprospiraceae bacterium]|nr:hypothetical protein [Saprospiraceae bacterium]